MGCDVYTIEPSEKAIEIMRLKCEAHHIAQERVFRGVGEYLPFKNEVFDFIYCFSVIEHVQNVEQTIQEALRVTKVMDIFIFLPMIITILMKDITSFIFRCFSQNGSLKGS